MKPLFIIYLIFLSTLANAQQLIFNKTYSNLVNVNSVIELANGNFLMAGNNNITLTDSLGNLIWNKTIVTSGSFNSLMETSDHHYLLTGTTGSIPRILKLDSSGNKIWSKEFPSGIFKDFAYSIVETFDSNYAFLVAGDLNIDTSTIVYQINRDGDSLWSRSVSNSFCYFMAQTIDSGFLISGVALDMRIGNFYPVVIKAHKNGQVIFADTFGLNCEPYLPVLPLADGTFILAGGTKYQSDFTPHDFVLKPDSAGSIIWERAFYEGGRPQCIRPCLDGGFVISGSLSYDAGSELAISRFDDMGNFKWRRYFNGKATGNNMSTTKDGGFVLTGYTQYGVFLAKLDSLGNCVLSVDDLNNQHLTLSVYPNPADDEITFNLGEDQEAVIHQISIYDLSGQVIKCFDNLSGSEFKANVKDLASGIYFYKVITSNDNDQQSYGKLLIE